MTRAAPVIAIDGPSGTGKGTIARLLANRLGWHMLDSGALYRVTAVGAEKRGIDFMDGAALAGYVAAMQVEFLPDAVRLDGEDVTEILRSEETGEKASVAAALPAVRHALLDRQQAFRRPPGLVADGRDMGTVVFPDAEVKIFLTASPGERALRRYKQLKNKEVRVSLPALSRNIEARDARDARRAVSPLAPAKDALVVDTTGVSIPRVLDTVLEEVKKRLPEAVKT